MGVLDTRLELRIWDGYAKGTLFDVLTDHVNSLSFSTSLHGGFKECRFGLPLDLGKSWLYLSRENLKGRHFAHVEVSQGDDVVWEGRVSEVTLVLGQSGGLEVLALGYWSSCRDQYYDAADSGNTNWASGGPHTVDDIIKEMLTNECPDISTDQSNIGAPTTNVVGIVLTDRDYPMNIILEKLAPLVDSGDSPWFFAIWEGRVPYFTERVVSDPVDWMIWLADTRDLRLTQSALNLRNTVLPVVGSTEGTAASNADSQSLYPTREVILSLPATVSATVANQARDAALTERNLPRQTSSVTINGLVSSTHVVRGVAVSGARVQRELWWVRAGDIIRITDLVPFSASTPTLDDLRTFFIMETHYDAVSNELRVQPDRPGSDLAAILARLNLIERSKSLG